MMPATALFQSDHFLSASRSLPVRFKEENQFDEKKKKKEEE